MATEDTLAEIELFSELSKQQRNQMASLMTPLRVPKGRVLTKQGAPGREFMIICEGTATVSRSGQELARLGPGDFFGELSLVAGIPRTATVTADTDMVLTALNPREFSSLLAGSPTLAKTILVGAVRRLYDLLGQQRVDGDHAGGQFDAPCPVGDNGQHRDRVGRST